MTGLAVELVAFDLTGTVVRDVGVMEGALKGALSHHGVPFTADDLASMRGAGKIAAFRSLVDRTVGAGRGSEESRSLVQEIYLTFKEKLREGYARGPVDEIPGAEAAMMWLREQGAKVAATTALDRDVAGPLLERLGWNERIFDSVVSTEDVPRGRPAPYMIFTAMMRTGVLDVRRVAVVGDTTHDLAAGTNAGAGWVIGVLTGAHSLEALGATPHTHLLKSVADLPKLFER